MPEPDNNRPHVEKHNSKPDFISALLALLVIDLILASRVLDVVSPLTFWLTITVCTGAPFLAKSLLKKTWRKKVTTTIGLGLLSTALLGLLIQDSLSSAFTTTSSETSAINTSESNSSTETIAATPSSTPVDNIQYKTPHQITGSNGRTRLYVLLNPVTPSKNEFQSDIKTITNILVSQCGPKTSIEFYDDRDLLEIAYQYKTKNEPAPLKYHSKLARHLIAMFDGELDNFTYPNSISFFPATDTQESPKLAPYIDTIEYNPVVASSVASSASESTAEPSPETIAESTPTSESTETSESSRARMQDKLAYSKSAVDQLLKTMKQKGIVMELHPEVNSVYLNPSAWDVSTYSQKEKLVTFFSSYCGYYCAVDGPVVHIKDGYSGKVLGETGVLGIQIKE